MKSLRLLLIVAAAWVSVWSTAAQAVPAFARQTAKPCSACHFQEFPVLNAFGREFKASGYTLKSMIPEHDDYIEADNLSLPATLNASLITKLRYRKTNGDDKSEKLNVGRIDLPDEAALFLGGRAGEHIGFIAEIGLNVNSKANFLNFKSVFTDKVGDTRISVIPFTSDGGGASFGFELLNTGAVNMTHALEHKTAITVQRFIGNDSGASPAGSEATGIALAASTSKWFATYTLWHPAWLGNETEAGHKKFANYFRAGLTPTIGEWDLGVGVQLFSGTSETLDSGASTPTTEVLAKAETKASFIDAQAQGAVGGMPLGVYFGYGKAPKSSVGGTANLYNASTTDDQKAWSLLGELGVMPRLSVFLGYLDGDQGGLKAKNTTIGLNWMVAQNSKLQFWNTKRSGSAYDPAPADGTSMTGLMLFSGF